MGLRVFLSKGHCLIRSLACCPSLKCTKFGLKEGHPSVSKPWLVHRGFMSRVSSTAAFPVCMKFSARSTTAHSSTVLTLGPPSFKIPSFQISSRSTVSGYVIQVYTAGNACRSSAGFAQQISQQLYLGLEQHDVIFQLVHNRAVLPSSGQGLNDCVV